LLQNPAMILAPNYVYQGQPFDLPTPSGGYGGDPPTRVQNIQLDKNNQLLFFVVDDGIYNKLGNYIAFLPYEGYEEIAIVPDPGNCARFYLITSGKDEGYYRTRWSTLDFTNAGSNNLNPTYTFRRLFFRI
jgi:hypothetical protein